ncbi:hypothetical protein V6N13_025939 [Hibiscus sabdariffa]
MEAPSWLLLSVAWLASLTILSTIFISRRCKQLKFPPGPKPWPIIGNLNLIGSLPHQSLHKLSQRYGPLMHLKFGSYPLVVASSVEMAAEFLKSHDQIFATRPPHAAGKYTAYNYSDILWAPYGPHWRQGRKIYQNELFSSKRLESFEYIRVEEMRAFVSRLYGLSGKPVVLIGHLTRLTLSNISRMVLGNKYFDVSGDDRNVSKSIVSLQELQSFKRLSGYVKRMKTLKKKLDRFHDHVFDEHKRKKEELGKDFVAQDMVDLLLQLADDPDLDVKLTYDAVRGLTVLQQPSTPQAPRPSTETTKPSTFIHHHQQNNPQAPPFTVTATVPIKKYRSTRETTYFGSAAIQWLHPPIGSEETVRLQRELQALLMIFRTAKEKEKEKMRQPEP